MKYLYIVILAFLLLGGCNPQKAYEGKVISQINMGNGNLSEIYFEDGSKIRTYGQPNLTIGKYYTFVVRDGLDGLLIESFKEEKSKE